MKDINQALAGQPAPVGTAPAAPIVQPVVTPVPTPVPTPAVVVAPAPTPTPIPAPATGAVVAPTGDDTAFMAALQASFDVAKASSGERVDIIDGTFTAQIIKMEIGKAKSSQRLQVATTFKLLDGTQAGETHYSYEGLQTKTGAVNETAYSIVIDKVASLGHVATDLNSLIAGMAAITAQKPTVKIRLVTTPSNGINFQNTYFA